MKITRKRLRNLILESMLNFPISYMDELSKSFETSIQPAKDNYRILKLIKTFSDGCQVIIENIFFDVNEPGEFNLYLAELATLDANGNVNDECYRKGYASSAISEFLRISDKYSIEVDLTAASQDEEKFPNRKLVRFYNDHGFQHYGNPNKGTVEMTRPRKIKESFRSFRPILKESLAVPAVFYSMLEDFIYNYLTFFVEKDFKHTLHFYQSVHKFTEKYAGEFFEYFESSPVFEDFTNMMEKLGIDTYQAQMIWIKQYFVENWESIMSKLGGMR